MTPADTLWPGVERQPPIRIGETPSATGYGACQSLVEAGQKVIVWPEELAPNQPRFPTPPWSQRP